MRRKERDLSADRNSHEPFYVAPLNAQEDSLVRLSAGFIYYLLDFGWGADRTTLDCESAWNKGSSLFGRLESTALKVWHLRRVMSFAGPRFSSGSALWLSHDGIRRTRRPNLTRVLITPGAIGTRAQANSPHPSSREGHLSASRQNLVV